MVDIALDAFIESKIEAFELAIANGNGPVSLRDFLPAKAHEKYLPLLTELIRVDLEFAFAEGSVKTVEDYLDEYPSVFASPVALERIAFEEFRLRRDRGHDVTAKEYATRFQIDTDAWGDGTVPIPLEGRETEAVAGKGADSTIHLNGHPVEAATAARHPELGSTWNGFKIVRRLGAGSFGEVLLAVQSSLSHRQVVLKFSRLDDFEAQRLAELQHANIVPIYSTHRYHDRTVLCMPYLGEHTLADFLKFLCGGTAVWCRPNSCWGGFCNPTHRRAVMFRRYFDSRLALWRDWNIPTGGGSSTVISNRPMSCCATTVNPCC